MPLPSMIPDKPLNTREDRFINVNGITFSYGQLLKETDKYLEVIRPLFRESTIECGPNETNDHRLSRLFSHLYYKYGYKTKSIYTEQET